jgi:methyl-accepting chemotaxis protein
MVQNGVKLVDGAGCLMSDIVEALRAVEGMIEQINLASSEQAAGLSQINETVGHLDQVTQQNAALVEEAAAAAASLEQQTKTLREELSRFRIQTAELC